MPVNLARYILHNESRYHDQLSLDVIQDRVVGEEQPVNDFRSDPDKVPVRTCCLVDGVQVALVNAIEPGLAAGAVGRAWLPVFSGWGWCC